MNEVNKPVIKVLGVGGGGCNAIAYMSYKEISGVDLLAANTDVQDLEKIKEIEKIQLGVKVTNGLGAGADPKIGRKAAEENEENIRSFLEGSNLLIISSGMGGGTGTGASPVIAEIAKSMGMLVVAVVTKPFDYERGQRMDRALKGIDELKDYVDSLIVIPNEKIRETISPDTALTEVFKEVDQVLHRAIEGISDVVTKPGFINIDFNDLKTCMKESGNAMIGLGYGEGENKAKKAALQAINCNLLEEKNLNKAKRAVINVTLGLDGTLNDFNEVGEIIKSITSDGANVIMGTSVDEKLNDQAKVTIIATDFNSEEDQKIEEEKEITPIKEEIQVEDKKDELPSFIKTNKSNESKIPKQDKKDQKNTKDDLKESIEIKDPIIEKEKIVEEKKEEITKPKIPSFLRKKVDI